MPGVRLIWSLFQRSTPSKVTDPAPSGRSIDWPSCRSTRNIEPSGSVTLVSFDLSSS